MINRFGQLSVTGSFHGAIQSDIKLPVHSIDMHSIDMRSRSVRDVEVHDMFVGIHSMAAKVTLLTLA
jgi:hypothetical protein